MLITPRQVIKGNQIRIRAKFFDFDRNLVTPNTASLTMTFTSNNIQKVDTVKMMFDPVQLQHYAIINTIDKDIGRLMYHIYQDDVGESATDGEIVIVGNRANLGQ